MIRSSLLATCLCALNASAQPLFTQTSASYEISAIAGDEFVDSDSSIALGSQTFNITGSLVNNFDTRATCATTVSPGGNRITFAIADLCITRSYSDTLCDTSGAYAIGFDLPAATRVTLKAFNIGWRAAVSNAGTAACSTILEDGAGEQIFYREAPQELEFFDREFILPAGSYTWRVFSDTHSDDAPGYPDSAQHSGSVNAILSLSFAEGPLACNASDLVAPYGTLNIDDVLAFLTAFSSGDPAADIAPPSDTLDVDDVLAFLNAFASGCP